MDKDKRIGIISGGAGWYNFGDDAQLYNNIRILQKRGYKSLFVMSPHSYIAKLCNLEKIYPSFHTAFPLKIMRNDKLITEKAIRMYYVSLDYENRKNMLNMEEIKLMDFLSKMYIIFVSGSGTINTRSLYGAVLTLLPCLIAKNFKKRIIYSGQGVLPLNNYKLESLITYALNQSNLIVTRDFKLGVKQLKRININMKKVKLGIDDAFTMPLKYSKKMDILENTIAINVSKFMTKGMEKIFYNLACKIKKNGYNVIFNFFQDEEELIKRVTKEEFPIYNFNNINPEEVAYFYSKVKASIGMRYHSFIFALAGGHPAINIFVNDYQEAKLRAIQEETKLPDFLISELECNVDIIYDMLKKAIETQPKFIEIINENWRHKGNLAIKYIEEIK